MKKLLLCCLSVAIASVAVSCLDNFEQKHTGGQTPTLPFDFDWSMTRDVAMTVGSPIVAGEAPEFALIYVYSSPVLDDDHLLAQGMVDRTRPEFRTAFTLPKGVENVYVQAIVPDGSRAAKMVPVAASELYVPGIQVTPAASDASRALFAKMIAAAAGERKASSMTIPVTEQVPVSYDRTIDATPSSSLPIGGDGQVSTYVIPAGVTIDRNINLVGWTNNLPTLYVAGRLELTGLVKVEKTRLVVLGGGEVIFGNGLAVNNTFIDRASVYVMPGGKLTVKSLSFDSGNGGTLANEGVLNVTDGHVKMSGGRIYTTTGINPGAEGEKFEEIFLQTSVGAEVHNDGRWRGDKTFMDSSSRFVNYENGVVTVRDVKMDQMTLDQRGLFSAEDVKFSSRVTLNNNCRMTVENFEAQAQSVINLASGALLTVTEDAVFHSITVSFARSSMLDVHTLAHKSYVSRFEGPAASSDSDGAQALFRIGTSEYKDKWNPLIAAGMIEVVSSKLEGFRCEGNGATIVREQTVHIPATECNGGEGTLIPDPIEPTDEFDVKGPVNTYCFEDGWPWCGDYDMNDLVVVASVDRKMKNGNVEAVRINWEARASGADNRIAFAVGLSRVPTANIALVVSTHAIGAGPFTLDGGLERDNEYAVIPFFNTVGEVLGKNSAYINTETGMPKIPVEKCTTTVTFSAPVAPDVVIESAFDFFLVVSRSNAPAPERWREIHLPTCQPTRHAVVTGFNTVIEGMPYKYYTQSGDLSNNGLMWGLKIPGEFRYPSEMNDIRTVYTEFLPWAKSSGTTNLTWYEGDAVSEKIYQ